MRFFERFFKKENSVADAEKPPEQLPQRNDPCWCGSGEKYKKCHSDQDQRYLARKKAETPSKSCGPVFG